MGDTKRFCSIVLALLGLPFFSGCVSLVVSGQNKTNTGSTGAVTSSSSSTGGTSQGTVSSSSAGGTTAGSGSTSGGAGTTGSSTGLPRIVDGGYVFCAVTSSGPDGGGGPATWMCTPGTYFCDASKPGTCFQCLSDSDCANRALPTYDFRRPHCDLSSGVLGYQNFCEECLDSAQCSGNPAGPFCDTDPGYPTSGVVYGSLEPPIETVGFESCGTVPTDCRVDGGRSCDSYDVFCERDSGECLQRSGNCSSNADCDGMMLLGTPNTPEPFCPGGPNGYCSSCSYGFCLTGSCFSDFECAVPNGSRPSQSCGSLGQCVCTENAQCGDIWPTCELQAGLVSSQGQPAGTCGCDSDAECGSLGFICYPGQGKDGGFQGSACVIPCTAPEYPPCGTVPTSEVTPPLPICDSSSGFCVGCTDDEQCRSTPGSGGPLCTDAGACSCRSDTDCPAGQTCQEYDPSFLPGFFTCAIAPLRCNPDSCGYSSCDWDSGVCLEGGGPGLPPPCLTDYDCSTTESEPQFPAPFCDQGHCVACRTDQDCVDTGSFPGPKCLPNGDCGCVVDGDCSAGLRCSTPADAGGSCATAICASDGDCPVDNFCDPSSLCRPRCDTGHSCLAPDPVCDTGNVAGNNGEGASGATPGAVWCYECLGPGDCDGGGCYPGNHTCGACLDASDCPVGEVCGQFSCRASCDAGPCPAGQLCNPDFVFGAGFNFCFECLGPEDCPNGEGCGKGTCGACYGPNAQGGSADCPPGDICSNYWSRGDLPGVCLANCDLRSCPADQPICAVLPALTPDHKYCFGCLQDSDCASLGPLAWCDTSVGVTFSCQVPP